MGPGTAGAIAGTVIGVLGAVIGTWCSVASAKGPHERNFLIKAAAGFWLGILVFLAILFTVPGPYRWLAFFPYGVALSLAIRYCNRRHEEIQRQRTPGSDFPSQDNPTKNSPS